MSRLAIYSIGAFFLALALFPLFSQEKAPPPISFYFTALDSQGKLVESLTVKDFQVFENDKLIAPRTLRFQRDIPVSLGILIDISRSMGSSNTQLALNLVKALATKMRSPDEFFIMAFSEEAELVADFISPEDYLEEALDHLGTGGRTYTALAVDRGLSKLREARNPRRILLIISAGRDTAGRGTLEHIGRYRFPIYSLGLSGTGGVVGAYDSLGALSLKGSALKVYADESGGLALHVPGQPQGEAVLQDLYREWKNQYLVEYDSPNLKPDGKYRKISIRPADPQFRVRCLERYFVPFKPRKPVPEY